MDADDRPTNARGGTPLLLALFAQRAPSLIPNWSGRPEEYSPSSFENQVFTSGTQHKEERGFWQSAFYTDTTAWDEHRGAEGSTHFSTRTSPISGAYANVRSYAELVEFEKQRLATCTNLSVRQAETWLSRARRKLTPNSPFQKRFPATTSIFEEPPSQSSLERSSLIIDTGGDPVILESSLITLEPKASENSGAGTHVAPPKVNGESITSSLSALANAVVLVQRLVRTRLSKLDEAASPPVNAVPAAASRPSLGDTLETQSGGGINME